MIRNDNNLTQINLTNTKIYEISDWFRSIIQRLKKEKKRIDQQKKWFDLVQQYMLKNNINILNSAYDSFSSTRDKVNKKNLWRYFSLSIVYKDRIEIMKKFAKYLRNYIIKKKRAKWIFLSRKIIRIQNKKDFQFAYSNYISFHNKWKSFFDRIRMQYKLKDFNIAHRELQLQKQQSLSISNESRLSAIRASYRRDWVSLAHRISRQNIFQKMKKMTENKNYSDDDDKKYDDKSTLAVPLSSSETQTKFPNKDSIQYKNLIRMVRNYSIQRFYSNLDRLHDEFREKQRQKKTKRQKEARKNWRYFIRNYRKMCQTDELEYSCQNLQHLRELWKKFTREVYLNNLNLLAQDGLTYLDTKFLRISQKWKFMIVRTFLNSKKKNIESNLQKYREKQLEKATNFGANFLFNTDKNIAESAPTVTDLVKENYCFKMSHFQRTIPSDFWHDAAYFAYSFTHKSLYDSVNLAVPLLTEHSTPLAEAFADCQGVLTTLDQNDRIKLPTEKNQNQNKQKSIHIIVGFGYNDKVSLLESVGE